MSGFAYGGSADLLCGHSFGHEDEVLQQLSDDDDLNDMVQRNIRDVLQQVSHDGEEPLHSGDVGRAGGLAAQARTSMADTGDPQASYDDMIGAASAGPSAQAQARHPRASGATGASAASQARRASSAAAPAAPASRPAARTNPVPNPRASNSSVVGAGPAAARRSASGEGASTSGAAVGGAQQQPAQGPGLSAAYLDVPGQPEASLRLHKARIKALEEDLGRANKALSDREKQLGEALRELKELRTASAGWARDKKALESQLEKSRKAAADAEAAARSTETQARELVKADSRAERERRAAEAEVRARDVRLQRALEDVERYKALLSEVRTQEREAKASGAQDAGRLLAENRKLERQRGELITAFKKQLKLIEVLKRQKVHLEAARALQFSEEEFLKTLDMGAA